MIFNSGLAVDAGLFDIWQQELAERHQIRYSELNPADMVINQPEEAELLVRAWFYNGRSRDLYIALFHNLHKMAIIKWLVQSPAAMIQGFLQFLPGYILIYRPRPVQLQFLIHLYSDDLAAYYPAIAKSLDKESCKYLLSRSANASLRRLLKTALQTAGPEHGLACFGLDPKRLSAQDFAGLYGKKNQNLLKALDSVADCVRYRLKHVYGIGPFMNNLAAVEAVFASGLVIDSLAILLDLYEDYAEKPNLAGVLEDEQAARRFARVLRKVAPVYAMLEHAPAAAAAYRALHERYFPGIPPSASAYASLELMDQLLSTNQSVAAVKAAVKLWHRQILLEGYGEHEPLFNHSDHLDMLALKTLVNDLRLSQPQEAFTLILAALWLDQHHALGLDSANALWIFTQCRDFWCWVPSQVFFNAQIWSQLRTMLPEESRQEGDRLLTRIQEMQDDVLQSVLKQRPDLFKQPQRIIERHILAGAFLGVFGNEC